MHPAYTSPSILLYPVCIDLVIAILHILECRETGEMEVHDTTSLVCVCVCVCVCVREREDVSALL